MMQKPKITVIGSSNTDLVAKAPKLPAPGETVLASEFIIAAGGKGANQAVAVARLGGDVTFVAKLGTDDFGDQSLENFGRDGIRTDFVFRDAESPSGVALIFVEDSGENMIVAAQGANARLSAADIDKARSYPLLFHRYDIGGVKMGRDYDIVILLAQEPRKGP